MANYHASTRSNYFRVKEAGAFEAWCHRRYLEYWTRGGADDAYAITADTGDCCGWPSYDTDADREIDFAAELADHLDPRDVAIIFEVGAEKLRYLTGYATAVHPDGRVVSVDIHEIYDAARRAFGPDLNITAGRY